MMSDATAHGTVSILMWMTACLQYVISREAGKPYLLRNGNLVLTRKFFLYLSELWVVGSLKSFCMAMINLLIRTRMFEAKLGLDKALCYFQPILQVGATVGTVSFNEIRTAATALLSQCARGQGQGGIATGIGMSFITSQNHLDESNNRIGSCSGGWTLIFDRREWQPCSHSRHLLAEYSMLWHPTQMAFLQGSHERYGCRVNECNVRSSRRSELSSHRSIYTFIK